MKKKKKSYTCHECEINFSLEFKGKKTPQLCPFCGDSISVEDDRPLLKDFDDYDTFDDDEYFIYDEDDVVDDDE